MSSLHFLSKNTGELDIAFTSTINILSTNKLIKLTRIPQKAASHLGEGGGGGGGVGGQEGRGGRGGGGQKSQEPQSERG